MKESVVGKAAKFATDKLGQQNSRSRPPPAADAAAGIPQDTTMTSKTAADWYAEYGAYHQNPTNKLIHWLCIPAIMTALVGLLWSLPVPSSRTCRFS